MTEARALGEDRAAGFRAMTRKRVTLGTHGADDPAAKRFRAAMDRLDSPLSEVQRADTVKKAAAAIDQIFDGVTYSAALQELAQRGDTPPLLRSRAIAEALLTAQHHRDPSERAWRLWELAGPGGGARLGLKPVEVLASLVEVLDIVLTANETVKLRLKKNTIERIRDLIPIVGKEVSKALEALKTSQSSKLEKPLRTAVYDMLAASKSGTYTESHKEAVLGLINEISKSDAVIPLPEKPPRLWQGRPRGNSAKGIEDLLFGFLREVYGPYFAAHRTRLRGYIHRHDLPLYNAIRGYERSAGGRELPSDISLPSERDVVQARLEKAFRDGLDALSPKARLSVSRKLRRDISDLDL